MRIAWTHAGAKRSLAVRLLAFFLSAGSAAAQPASAGDSFLEHLAGKWVLRGTIAGKATTHDIASTWVLDHRYLQIHERSRETRGDGKAQYEAIVLVSRDPATGEYQCLWLDTTTGGGLAPEAFARAKRSGDTLPFLFREADGTLSFNNTFSYDRKEDSWTWRMDNVREGKASPFGFVRLTRR